MRGLLTRVLAKFKLFWHQLLTKRKHRLKASQLLKIINFWATSGQNNSVTTSGEFRWTKLNLKKEKKISQGKLEWKPSGFSGGSVSNSSTLKLIDCQVCRLFVWSSSLTFQLVNSWFRRLWKVQVPAHKLLRLKHTDPCTRESNC